MKTVVLTRKQVALVDDDDYEKLNKYKWQAYPNNNSYHARARIKEKGLVKMHRYIMNAPQSMDVDHINHNPLDNRKCNLRICTRSQNLMNTRKRKNTTSKYKGVSYSSSKGDRNTKKWAAYINIGKRITIGRYRTEKEAAQAYNEMASLHFGDYALINNI